MKRQECYPKQKEGMGEKTERKQEYIRKQKKEGGEKNKNLPSTHPIFCNI
jgi:hypothetical protein